MSRFAWRLPSQRLRPPRAAREHMAVFMAGLPGSGKTRVIDGHYGLSKAHCCDRTRSTTRSHDPTPTGCIRFCWRVQVGRRAHRGNFKALHQKHRFRRSWAGPAAKVEQRVQRMDDAKRAGWL